MRKVLFLYYKNSFKYIAKSWKEILFIIGIFIVFLLIGIFVQAPENISIQIMAYLNQLLAQTEGYGFGEMFLFIFFNNLKSSFFGLYGGIAFGVFSLFTSLINGYLLGFVSHFVSSQEGAGVLLRLIPHGIFELPAVFISLGMGARLGSFIFKKEKVKFLKENMKNSLIVFVFIVLPLLIIAAIIESTLIIFG
jgi:stage II sporulation protein M